MAKKVIWTERALADIDEICRFIARDSKVYAEVFASRVFSAGEEVATFPLSGRMVPRFNKKTLREIFLGNYRIVYRVRSQSIQVITVCHCAKTLKV